MPMRCIGWNLTTPMILMPSLSIVWHDTSSMKSRMNMEWIVNKRRWFKIGRKALDGQEDFDYF